MSYCNNCGKVNKPESRFCGFCGAQLAGQPVQAPVPFYGPPPPPPPPDYQQAAPAYQPPQSHPQPAQLGQEKVFGVILLRKPKSMGRYVSWTAVITSHRIIFALMTAQMINDAAMQARNQAKAEGKGFFGAWGDQLRATFGYTQKYLTMDPNASLAETPGNVAVDNGAISEIKLHLKDINRGQQVHQHEFSIDIISAQVRYEFRMEQKSEFVNLLKQVYGERVKMPFGYFGGGGVNVKIGPF